VTVESLSPATDLELLRTDIDRQAGLLATSIPTLRADARRAATAIGAAFPRIYLVGCGDSLNAGMATQLLWERLTGVPVEAIAAMSFSRYAVETAPPGSLVITLSQSGTVRRVVEAVRVARQRGLATLVLTGKPGSPLGQEPADVTMPFVFPKLGFVPGTTSYAVAIAANIELAAAFSRDEHAAAAVRDEMDRLPDLIAASRSVAWSGAERHVGAFEKSSPVLVLGSGPHLATACFTARKFFEVPQLMTIAQETEEYAHDEFSIVDKSFRVLLYAPADRGLGRSIEIANRLRQLGTHLAVVTDASVQAAFSATADLVYSMPSVSADLAPLTYALPSQALTYLLGRHLGGSYYHTSDPMHARIGDAQIYESEISIN
jgi:glucosamine--fructose-6-phosphate aminotransferase (isomerizing)